MKGWFDWPDDSWQEQAMGAILSVTFIGITGMDGCLGPAGGKISVLKLAEKDKGAT
jgi:hypothetical protein